MEQETKEPIRSLSEVASVIRKDYREELWLAVKTELAVIASMSLKGRDHCLVLIFEGPSGKGKSIVTRIAAPDRPSTKAFLQRVDDFTPASFVSHAANRSKKELTKIDLLPRLKDKTMLTKELAPLFRADDKELKNSFATLTSVLDGEGYLTNSGSQGERGYSERHIFNWVGATTPVPGRTHKVMAQLGNRLLFYEIVGEEEQEDELLQFAQDYNASEAVDVCRTAVNDFIEAHFERCPLNTVDPSSIVIPEELHRKIIRSAQLIAHGRVEIEYSEAYGFETGSPEGSQRVILLLQAVARGLALIDERTAVDDTDLAIIRHIAFSSIPPKRRELLRVLLTEGGEVTSTQITANTRMARPTAIKRMEELGSTGIAAYSEPVCSTSTPASLKLGDKWTWLLEGAKDTP